MKIGARLLSQNELLGAKSLDKGISQYLMHLFHSSYDSWLWLKRVLVCEKWKQETFFGIPKIRIFPGPIAEI